MHRLSTRLLLASGVLAAGAAAVLVLQDHFVGDFTASLNVVSSSYRAWHDPVALLCAFASIAVAFRIAVGRWHRLALALVVVGCTLAGSVYVHQQDVHTFVCPPGYHCPAIFFPPDLWHDPRSLLVFVAGLAASVVVMLPHRWIVAQGWRLRPQRY